MSNILAKSSEIRSGKFLPFICICVQIFILPNLPAQKVELMSGGKWYDWRERAQQEKRRNGIVLPLYHTRSSNTAALDFHNQSRYSEGQRPYIWHNSIVATVFWIGEAATPQNPTPNTASAWDMNWSHNYGGYDNPDPKARVGFRPKAFIPRLNPFYIALPYNDIAPGGKTRNEAYSVIPWFKKAFRKRGHTVLRGRWVAIRNGRRVCFAQWEDVGPFVTDDWQYVFGLKRPRNKRNKAAGIDISPAVRDYLGMKNIAFCDWRFVDLREVRPGPWQKYGINNHFYVKSLR